MALRKNISVWLLTLGLGLAAPALAESTTTYYFGNGSNGSMDSYGVADGSGQQSAQRYTTCAETCGGASQCLSMCARFGHHRHRGPWQGQGQPPLTPCYPGMTGCNGFGALNYVYPTSVSGTNYMPGYDPNNPYNAYNAAYGGGAWSNGGLYNTYGTNNGAIWQSTPVANPYGGNSIGYGDGGLVNPYAGYNVGTNTNVWAGTGTSSISNPYGQ